MSVAIDPVCGMEVPIGPDALTSTVDPRRLANAGQPGRHRGVAETWADGAPAERFWFCGRGCLLDFGDEPERYLDAAFAPSGM